MTVLERGDDSSNVGGPSWVTDHRSRARTMFTWDVRAGDRGWSGVTGDRDTAMRHVHQTLVAQEPGAWGTVQQVALEPLGRIRYVRLRTVAEAWVDARTRAVVWRHG